MIIPAILTEANDLLEIHSIYKERDAHVSFEETDGYVCTVDRESVPSLALLMAQSTCCVLWGDCQACRVTTCGCARKEVHICSRLVGLAVEWQILRLTLYAFCGLILLYHSALALRKIFIGLLSIFIWGRGTILTIEQNTMWPRKLLCIL